MMNVEMIPGMALNIKAFKTWIENAEETPTSDLKEAKAKWVLKKHKPKKLTRQTSLSILKYQS